MHIIVVSLTGIPSVSKALLVPMATGMTLSLCLIALKRRNRTSAKYVLWSRIDQKSCFKSMLVASLQPVIIDTIRNPTTNGLETDLPAFEQKINELCAENIVCIFSTTSCFAPRESDDIFSLAKLAAKHNIPHLINNAYGLQSADICRSIQKAANGPGRRVDLFVQSTDKNLMVPVGGAVVCGFDAEIVKSVGICYAGRASSAHSLDVLMTLLSVGMDGYRDYLSKREHNFQVLKEGIEGLAREFNLAPEFNFVQIRNSISVAFSLKALSCDCHEVDVDVIGSMLFTRGVSGSRLVKHNTSYSLEDIVFKGSLVNRYW